MARNRRNNKASFPAPKKNNKFGVRNTRNGRTPYGAKHSMGIGGGHTVNLMKDYECEHDFPGDAYCECDCWDNYQQNSWTRYSGCWDNGQWHEGDDGPCCWSNSACTSDCQNKCGYAQTPPTGGW